MSRLYTPLNTGYQMPTVAFGTWPLEGNEAESSVVSALGMGYRHIDTAALYENEAPVGRGIISSGLKREEIFVTTKLRGQMLGADKARIAVEGSLCALQLDYIDLYLIHWPLPWLDLYVETYQALLELAREGLIRSVGVANFKEEHLARIMAETRVVPAVNQIELSPTRARRELRQFHSEKGIVTSAWSPLDRGGDLLADSTVLSIANSLGRSPAQVILRWHLDNNIAPVPRSADEQRRQDNIRLFDFELSPKHSALLSALDRGPSVVVDSDFEGWE